MLLSFCQAAAINVNEKCCCPSLLRFFVISNFRATFLSQTYFLILFLLFSYSLRRSLLFGKFVSAPGKCIPQNAERLCMCLHALQQLPALLCCAFRVQHKLAAAAGNKSLLFFFFFVIFSVKSCKHLKFSTFC